MRQEKMDRVRGLYLPPYHGSPRGQDSNLLRTVQ